MFLQGEIIMVKPKVFFSDRQTNSNINMLDKLESIFKKLGLPETIVEDDKVMIKTHFGQWGNTNHVRPAYVRKIVDLVKAAGGIPFVTDTCGIGYGNERPYGGRTTALEYLARAEKNGYNSATVGAPILLADGYWGVDGHNVKINGDYLKTVSVASALLDCDKVIVLSHSKFHYVGLASAFKNVGVGLVTKKNKTAVHSPKGLEIHPEKCIGSKCSECVSVCPVRCIKVSDTVEVDLNLCVQCGHCSSICSSKLNIGALRVPWKSQNMAERIVENTLGVLDALGRDKFYFINLAIDISDMCDCVCYGAQLLMHDIGIFGSTNILAIDHATIEAMRFANRNPESPNTVKIDDLIEKTGIFFKHGQKMGLGTTDYELIEVKHG
jgi:uncharacterized Fe-S center protein